MSKISNFTAKAKRKWYDGSTWHTDNLDFFQFASCDIYSGSDILHQNYELGKSVQFFFNLRYQFYKPGLVYKPKRYYTCSQMFYTKEQLENLLTNAKNFWNYEPSNSVYMCINGSENTIITLEKDGYYLFPVAFLQSSPQKGITEIQRACTFSVSLIYTKFKPQNIKISYEGRNLIASVYESGNWRAAKRGTDYDINTTVIYSSLESGFNEWCSEVTRQINDLYKGKYYFYLKAQYNISWVTIDGIEYAQYSNKNYDGSYYSGPFVQILVDVTNCPTAINPGFILIGNNIYSHRESNGMKLLYDFQIDTENAPDPTENPLDDDPNDEDLGSQDNIDYDSDIGGNGDHDNTSDSLEEEYLPTLSATSNGLITSWNVSPSQLENLATKLWNPDSWEAIKQYFTNPMSSILGLSIIPVAPKTTSGTIHLGGYNTEISSNKLSNDYVKVDCGSIPITRYYGSYLDYSPFTKINITLPYVGEIDLDPDQIMEKTLSVSYHVNCITGEFCCYLLADNKVFATFTGSCAKQLPICQTDYSSIIASTVQIAATAITAGAAGASAGAAASGIDGANMFNSSIDKVSALAGAESLVKANSSLLGSVMSMKPNYRHSSQLGTGAGQLAPQIPFLTIIRPNLDLASNYKSFVGYPCNKNIVLSKCSGFTQVEASNLSVPSASLDELAEIKELLLKGVII